MRGSVRARRDEGHRVDTQEVCGKKEFDGRHAGFGGVSDPLSHI